MEADGLHFDGVVALEVHVKRAHQKHESKQRANPTQRNGKRLF